MDRYSPVAPARIRVLVLPVGQQEIQRSTYFEFLDSLRRESSVVLLSDVDANENDKHLLAPHHFRAGALLYDYTSSALSTEHRDLSPFELFREPLLVLGLYTNTKSEGVEDNARATSVAAAADHLRQKQPHAVHRDLVVHGGDIDEVPPPNVTYLRDFSDVQEAMKNISALFLRELATWAAAQQAVPTVQTPGRTALVLQRPQSRRPPTDSRPNSGFSTPPNRSEVNSPVENESRSPPQDIRAASPPTSFDQIANANLTNIARSDSRASNRSGRNGNGRASSQERVAVQGFGSSQAKSKERGKARVGITVASIRMMAGHWEQALVNLIEHTNKARQLGDHLWHAKGLENMVVCMILLAWAGQEFSVPTLCLPGRERGSMHIADRFNPSAADFSLGSLSLGTPIQRLAALLPDLLQRTLKLYWTLENNNLELASLIKAEAAIRFAKLIVITWNEGGEFTDKALTLLVEAGTALSSADNAEMKGRSKRYVPSVRGSMSRADVVAMLDGMYQAQDTGEGIGPADCISILAGVSSVYSLMDMDRKKAVTMRQLVQRLTKCLLEARKLGAAEAGIHPAATLSADFGLDPGSALLNEGALNAVMSNMARTYGVELLTSMERDKTGIFPTTVLDFKSYGNADLKFEVLRDMIALCEAQPDPAGAIQTVASFLRLAGPSATVDSSNGAENVSLPKEEQIRLFTTIGRLAVLARQWHLSINQAEYWDPFLVRGVSVELPKPHLRLLDRKNLRNSGQAPLHQPSTNPLLYDPNARRPNTAQQVEDTPFVLCEWSTLIVTLQNPFDASVNIESIQIITEGIELQSRSKPTSLGPSCIQEVYVSVFPCDVGETRITACRVKVAGCAEQVFPIYSKPWMTNNQLSAKAFAPSTVSDAVQLLKPDLHQPEPDCPRAIVVEQQPLLMLDNAAIIEQYLFLLEGEGRSIDIEIHNVSQTLARILNVRQATDSAQRIPTVHEAEMVIQPGAKFLSTNFITAKPGISLVYFEFTYCKAADDSSTDSLEGSYARTLTVPVSTTVHASIRATHADILPPVSRTAFEEEHFVFSVNLTNLWTKMLSFHCSTFWDTHDDAKAGVASRSLLAPGHSRRVQVKIDSRKAREHLADITDHNVLEREILSRIFVFWSDNERSGSMDLAALTLSEQAVDNIRGAPLRVELDLKSSLALPSEDRYRTKTRVKAGTFVSAVVKLVSYSSISTPLQVQLEHLNPTTKQGFNPGIISDGNSRFVPPIEQGGCHSVRFHIYPAFRGTLQTVATVSPASVGHGVLGRSKWSAHSTAELEIY